MDPSYDLKLDLSFTYSYDKYSCVKEMYFIHICFAYLISISGLLSFLTRLVPYFKNTHSWFGRFYIVSMLWCTATSILINNTGLPLAVLITFLWVLLGMSMGWFSIILYNKYLYDKAILNVENKLKNIININVIDLNYQINREKILIRKNKNRECFLYLKTLHGLCMLSSWMCIVGRLFASDQSGNFKCYTYPVYKNNNINITYVPIHDPEFSRLPWAFNPTLWGVLVVSGTILTSTLLTLLLDKIF